jgi:hypothetical protein
MLQKNYTPRGWKLRFLRQAEKRNSQPGVLPEKFFRVFSSLPVWIEFGEQGDVIGYFMDAGIVELECDAVAFLDQPAVQGIGFPKPAYPAFVVVAMLAIAVLSCENLLNVRRGVLDVVAMFIDGVEKQAQRDALIADINPGDDLFALSPRLGVNQHIPSPAKTAADFVPEIVAESGHLVVECEHKPLVGAGNKIEPFFF